MGDHLLHLSRRLGHRRDFLRRGWRTILVARGLIITILIYAILLTRRALADWASGHCIAFSRHWESEEWAAGAALVAETWPEENERAAGILAIGLGGRFILAVVQFTLKGYGWRIMFVIGVLPAFVSLLVRWHVKEPDRWAKAHDRDTTISPTHMTDIFHPPFRRSTIVGSALAFVAVFGLWGATNWAPTLIRELPDLKASDAATLSASVSYAIMALNGGALFGYLGFGPLADRFGRRAVFAFMCLGSFVMLPITYLLPTTYAGVLMLLPLLGFFNNGIFSGFPILSPQSSTHQAARHRRRFLLQCRACAGIRFAVSHRLAGDGTRQLWASRKHGGIDLSGRISSLNLCTGDQGKTTAGITASESVSHTQPLTSHQSDLA
jgi:MFS family permease